MLSRKVSVFQRYLLLLNIQQQAEQLLKLPFSMRVCVWAEYDEVLLCQRVTYSRVIPGEFVVWLWQSGAVTPVMAGWGTEAGARCVWGGTSQWWVKLITTGTWDCGFLQACFPSSEISVTQKWMDFILLQFEPHVMQIQPTSRSAGCSKCERLVAKLDSVPSLCLVVFLFLLLLLISLLLTLLSSLLSSAHIKRICLVLGPCWLSTKCHRSLFLLLKHCSCLY